MTPSKILLNFVLTIALAAASDTWAGKREERSQRRDIFKELNLTSEQKEKIEKIRNSQKEETKTLRKEVKNAQKSLKASLQSEKSDAELLSAHKEIMRLRNELSEKRFSNMLSIRAILNPEQRKKMAEMRSKGPGRRGMQDADEDSEDDGE